MTVSYVESYYVALYYTEGWPPVVADVSATTDDTVANVASLQGTTSTLADKLEATTASASATHGVAGRLNPPAYATNYYTENYYTNNDTESLDDVVAAITSTYIVSADITAQLDSTSVSANATHGVIAAIDDNIDDIETSIASTHLVSADLTAQLGTTSASVSATHGVVGNFDKQLDASTIQVNANYWVGGIIQAVTSPVDAEAQSYHGVTASVQEELQAVDGDIVSSHGTDGAVAQTLSPVEAFTVATHGVVAELHLTGEPLIADVEAVVGAEGGVDDQLGDVAVDISAAVGTIGSLEFTIESTVAVFDASGVVGELQEVLDATQVILAVRHAVKGELYAELLDTTAYITAIKDIPDPVNVGVAEKSHIPGVVVEQARTHAAIKPQSIGVTVTRGNEAVLVEQEAVYVSCAPVGGSEDGSPDPGSQPVEAGIEVGVRRDQAGAVVRGGVDVADASVAAGVRVAGSRPGVIESGRAGVVSVIRDVGVKAA